MPFSEELNDSLNKDVYTETKQPTSCDPTEEKESKMEGASLSSIGE